MLLISWGSDFQLEDLSVHLKNKATSFMDSFYALNLTRSCSVDGIILILKFKHIALECNVAMSRIGALRCYSKSVAHGFAVKGLSLHKLQGA